MNQSLPLKQIIEGAILASDVPLTIDKLLQLFDDDPPTKEEVRAALDDLAQDCAGRGYELKQVASGYRFQVKEEYGEWVSRLWKEKPPRYSRALLETLALVAYYQPITRGDIEDIRGVAVSTNIMRTLLERDWVRIVGHRDAPGQPALYATTKTFLDYFNLGNLDELPPLMEIKGLIQPNKALDEQLNQPRTLDLIEPGEQEAPGLGEAELDAVTEQVDTIEENIRRTLTEDSEELPEPEDADEEFASAEAEPNESDQARAGGAVSAASSVPDGDEEPQ